MLEGTVSSGLKVQKANKCESNVSLTQASYSRSRKEAVGMHERCSQRHLLSCLAPPITLVQLQARHL